MAAAVAAAAEAGGSMGSMGADAPSGARAKASLARNTVAAMDEVNFFECLCLCLSSPPLIMLFVSVSNSLFGMKM